MLAQQASSQRRFRPSILVILLAGMPTAEVALPEDVKPSKAAGNAAANFCGEVMDEDIRKRLDYSEQEPVAMALGERERLQPHINGLCAASAWLDPEIAALCRGMANSYFKEALPPARTYRERYGRAS